MDRKAKLFLPIGVAILLAGCANIGRPNWCNPGTARQQQLQAEQYDPYPENDIGPAVVGGRPRGFENPPAETIRSRWPLVKQP